MIYTHDACPIAEADDVLASCIDALLVSANPIDRSELECAAEEGRADEYLGEHFEKDPNIIAAVWTGKHPETGEMVAYMIAVQEETIRDGQGATVPEGFE